MYNYQIHQTNAPLSTKTYGIFEEKMQTIPHQNKVPNNDVMHKQAFAHMYVR